MIYKRFRINCTFRILILAATIFCFFYFSYTTKYYVSNIIIGCLIIYQIYTLIYYVEKTNRELTHFLESIKYSDFTQTFTGRGFGTSFDELKSAFAKVIAEFRQARAEKEEHFRYLQTVVQHIGIGLISFTPNGQVELINAAAKRLLKINRIKNIFSLKSFSAALVETLMKIKPGEKALVKVVHENEFLQLAIYGTEFRLREQRFTLVSLQNIQSELEDQEMEAWHNLIRVLTHEIMNSITPIASLAATANQLLASLEMVENTGAADTAETITDVEEALRTIERRSHGLLHFVQAYRSLTRIPRPDFQIFSIAELFQRVYQLNSGEIEKSRIDFKIQVNPETLELTADPELIDQVLINLIRNAIQALESQAKARIQLKAQLDSAGRVVLQVIDNGPGIMKEVLEKVFIPFFTTKPKGSGIGLSLSRQIMRLHHGIITVQSEPGVETIFILRF